MLILVHFVIHEFSSSVKFTSDIEYFRTGLLKSTSLILKLLYLALLNPHAVNSLLFLYE